MPLQQRVQAELLSCVSTHLLHRFCGGLTDRASHLQFLRIPPDRAESCGDVFHVSLFPVNLQCKDTDIPCSAPTAGGQYHWVSEFAPPHLQKFLSYYSGKLLASIAILFAATDSVTGWLSALAWLVGAASSIFLPGDIIPAVAALAHPSYHPEPWHSYLIILGVASLAYIINVYLVKYLPLLEGFIAAYMIIVFFSVVITLLVLSPKNSAGVVFQSFEPIVDGSNGVMAVLSSQVLLFFSLLGSDSVVSIPSRAFTTRITND
jgi:amino acid transporter